MSVNPNAARGNGFFNRESHIKIRDVTDGTSNTIMVGEVSWGTPNLTGKSTNQRWYGNINAMGESANTATQIRGAEEKMNLPPAACVAANGPCNQSFHSNHEGGAQFLMGDGAVRFVSENIQHTGPLVCRLCESAPHFDGLFDLAVRTQRHRPL